MSQNVLLVISNHFMSLVVFLFPLKTETKIFLFSGGIERCQWYEMELENWKMNVAVSVTTETLNKVQHYIAP